MGIEDATDGELRVMKALWRAKKGSVAEVRELHNQMFGAGLAYTTVMTLLGRLAAKGAVRVDRERQPFIYRPAHKEESVLRRRVKQFVETVFDGNAMALVLRLVEDEKLTPEKLRRLEAKLGGKGARKPGGK